MFLEGKTYRDIVRYLTDSGTPTPSGGRNWSVSTVMSILRNEKYKGDAILKKRYTVDYLAKKTKVNEGAVPQYYIENSHPAIIERETFDLVQVEMERRKVSGRGQRCRSPFSGKVVCGECGGLYGSKVWHSTTQYKRTIW